MGKFISGAVAFVKKPAVSHALAVTFSALATYFATGPIDLTQLLK